MIQRSPREKPTSHPTDPEFNRKIFLKRMLVVKIALLAVVGIIALRLVQIQVVESSTYQEIARRQYESRVALPAMRGSIFDRTGKVLATNTLYVSFGADPVMLGKEAQTVADRFAKTFGKSRAAYLEKLTSRDRRFTWLERGVAPERAAMLNVASVKGMVQLNEPKRLYHYDHLAGQLVGFTNVDNEGLSGIELQHDDILSGVNGYAVMQRDGRGRRFASVDLPRVDPVNGKHVVLTIDLECQALAEEELRRGIERTKAESGLVIMMDPRTGEMLALAMQPSLNPNKYATAGEASMKNRAITDMFEPGSIFKVVTAAAALQNGLVSAEQKFYAENGKYEVQLSRGKPRIITDTKEHHWLTFREAMEVSSNIVMAKVSDIIGAERFYTTARNFGFGTKTGVELPGEVGGDLKKPTQWSQTSLHSMSFGYEVGVTPIQMVAAYAAVANGGLLMKPYIVRQILDQHYDAVVEENPETVRRVISEETARQITGFFEGVVERGTGSAARVNGVRIAGKTGTSRKLIDGKYQPGYYTASFVGFFPANDPQIVCLVMLDNPREGGYTGGLASAPIFGSIAEKVVATSTRFRRESPPVIGKQASVVPDVSTLSIAAAERILSAQGFVVEVTGKGEAVSRQVPSPGQRLLPGEKVILGTERISTVRDGYALVPSVKGLTIRRAINRLSLSELDVQVEGSGVVSAQYPAAGQHVKVGTRVALRCIPRSSILLTAN